MFVLSDSEKILLPQEVGKKFFIQAWYSMVHDRSLDSHRVKSMNSLNILRELKELMNKNLSGIDKDVLACLEEAEEMVSADRIFHQHSPHLRNEVLELLQEAKPILGSIIESKGKDKDKVRYQELKKMFVYSINDFLSNKESYIARLRHELIAQLSITPVDLEMIRGHTSSLLSILIDEGYSLEGLNSFLFNLLASRECIGRNGFDKNLKFSFSILKLNNYEYDVYFRLKGIINESLIPNDYPEISFLRKPVFTNNNPQVDEYIKRFDKSLFAKIEVTAHEDRAAGMFAREKMYAVFDLLRFELEKDIIENSDEFISFRKKKGEVRIFKLPKTIPNPTNQIDKKEFLAFIKGVESIYNNLEVERESKEKIKSAFRFYRMGKDAQPYPNKYLNWWTALEYLTRSNREVSIIKDMSLALVDILGTMYISKHLEDLRQTLHYLKVTPSISYLGVNKITSIGAMNNLKFYELLKDSTEASYMKSQLNNCPLVCNQFDYVSTKISSPSTLLDFICKHEKRLHWHLNRLWRIRCDISHSAQYSLNLTLLCANLEYYLKVVISFIIEQFQENNTIISLNEVFDRIGRINKKLKSDLGSNSDSYLKDVVLTFYA